MSKTILPNSKLYFDNKIKALRPPPSINIAIQRTMTTDNSVQNANASIMLDSIVGNKFSSSQNLH